MALSAGTSFDAAAARDALARAEAAQAIATVAARLARRATSEAIRNRALVSDRAMVAQLAMSRAVRLPEGEPFVEANAQVRALMRAQSKGPAKAKSAKVKPTVNTTTTPANGVVIAKPAAPPSPLPS